jgi:hypothetical protein
MHFSGDAIQACCFPHWLPVVGFAIFALALWSPAPQRFRLRTLLIASTLVAGVLAIIVAAR